MKPLLYEYEMVSAPNRSTSQKDYLKVVGKTSDEINILSYLHFFIHFDITRYQCHIRYAFISICRDWQKFDERMEEQWQWMTDIDIFVSYKYIVCLHWYFVILILCVIQWYIFFLNLYSDTFAFSIVTTLNKMLFFSFI